MDSSKTALQLLLRRVEVALIINTVFGMGDGRAEKVQHMAFETDMFTSLIP